MPNIGWKRRNISPDRDFDKWNSLTFYTDVLLYEDDVDPPYLIVRKHVD